MCYAIRWYYGIHANDSLLLRARTAELKRRRNGKWSTFGIDAMKGISDDNPDISLIV